MIIYFHYIFILISITILSPYCYFLDVLLSAPAIASNTYNKGNAILLLIRVWWDVILFHSSIIVSLLRRFLLRAYYYLGILYWHFRYFGLLLFQCCTPRLANAKCTPTDYISVVICSFSTFIISSTFQGTFSIFADASRYDSRPSFQPFCAFLFERRRAWKRATKVYDTKRGSPLAYIRWAI